MEFFREVTPLRSQDICVVLDSANNGFDYPIHVHPEYELNLILGTNGIRIVGDSAERFYESDLVLLGPYLPHKWEDDQESRDKQLQYRVITIQFDINLFATTGFSKACFNNIKEMLNQSRRGVRFSEATLKEIYPLMEKLTEQDDFQNAMRFLQLLNVLANAKEYSFLTTNTNTSNNFSSEKKRIQKAYNLIMLNYKKSNFTVSDIAAKLNMSCSAFSHFFKKNSFRSFSNFITDLRLGNACKLLLSTDKTSSQIAIESGFNNVSNFNRLFKKYKKYTPIEYRNQYNAKSNFDWSSQRTPWQFIPNRKGQGENISPHYYSTKINHI